MSAPDWTGIFAIKPKGTGAAKPYASPGGRGSLSAELSVFERWAWFPYGEWSCEDGRRVLFNRFYEPIAQRIGDGPIAPGNPAEWVKYKKQSYLYAEQQTEQAERAHAIKAGIAWALLQRHAASQVRYTITPPTRAANANSGLLRVPPLSR